MATSYAFAIETLFFFAVHRLGTRVASRYAGKGARANFCRLVPVPRLRPLTRSTREHTSMNNLQPDTTAPSGAGPLTRSGQAVASGSGLRDYHSATPHSFAPTPSGSYPPQSLQQPAQINYTPSGSNFQYQSPEYQHQMLPPLSNQRIFDVPQASSSSSSTYYSHLEQPSPGFPPHPMTQPYYPMPAHQQHLTRQIPVPDPSSELIDERVRNAQLDERHAQGQHLLAQLRSELAFLDSLLGAATFANDERVQKVADSARSPLQLSLSLFRRNTPPCPVRSRMLCLRPRLQEVLLRGRRLALKQRPTRSRSIASV